MANLPAHAQMFHLRRIPPSKHSDQGHNPLSSLILLDTSSNMISRDHAEITGVKTASGRIEKYHITDHSLNGTYINDRRCKSRTPTQIVEGDIIKFGHMNGASIKDCQTAPQANAEFAFVVERANPNFNYLGFRDGRRYRPIVCRGEVFNCIEGEQRVIDSREPISAVSKTDAGRPVQPVPPSAHIAPPLSSVPPSSSSMHQTNSVSNTLNFFPYGSPNLASFPYSYPGLPTNLFSPALAQWNLQQAQAAVSGFRAPNVFANPGAAATSLAAGLPPSTTQSFLPRDFLQQAAANNNLVNSLLTPVTAAAVAAAQEAAGKMSAAAPVSHTVTAAQPSQQTADPVQQIKDELVTSAPAPAPAVQPGVEPGVPAATTTRPPVASPPMECDSSVPSPPKPTVPATQQQQPAAQQIKPASPVKPKDDDHGSERSFAESPPPRRAPAPAPWDSTPSPRPRDSPDRESGKEKKEQKAATVTKHRKTNEIARLLDDLTETSWVNQVKRVSSSSRRPTDEVIVEKNAKKEKKKKEKEKARRERDEVSRMSTSSLLGSPPTNSASSRAEARKRLKQLSDEESVSSDSDSEEEESVPSPSKTAQKRKKSPVDSSSEESESEEDSDDSTAKSRKRAKKKKGPRRSSLGGGGSGRKAKAKTSSVDVVSVKKVEIISAQAEVDANGDPVITHDPSSWCGLQKQCTTPQDDQVNWICCDDCDTWYHNICILGHDAPPKTKHFFCGCVKKGPKNDKKLKKKGRRV